MNPPLVVIHGNSLDHVTDSLQALPRRPLARALQARRHAAAHRDALGRQPLRRQGYLTPMPLGHAAPRGPVITCTASIPLITEHIVSNKGQLLQDPFLNLLRKEHVPVSIYLVNGIKLQGHIESFDQYVVLLRNTVTQMVYKHAISTVVPGRAVNFHAAETGRTGLTPRRQHRARDLEFRLRTRPRRAATSPTRAVLVGVDFGARPALRRHARRTGPARRIGRRRGGGARHRAPQGARPGAVRRLGQGRRDQGAGRRPPAPHGVIFDQALSPAQQRNLERHLGVPVADRTVADPRHLRRARAEPRRQAAGRTGAAAVPVHAAGAALVAPGAPAAAASARAAARARRRSNSTGA